MAVFRFHAWVDRWEGTEWYLEAERLRQADRMTQPSTPDGVKRAIEVSSGRFVILTVRHRLESVDGGHLPN